MFPFQDECEIQALIWFCDIARISALIWVRLERKTRPLIPFSSFSGSSFGDETNRDTQNCSLRLKCRRNELLRIDWSGSRKQQQRRQTDVTIPPHSLERMSRWFLELAKHHIPAQRAQHRQEIKHFRDDSAALSLWNVHLLIWLLENIIFQTNIEDVGIAKIDKFDNFKKRSQGKTLLPDFVLISVSQRNLWSLDLHCCLCGRSDLQDLQWFLWCWNFRVSWPGKCVLSCRPYNFEAWAQQ